MHSRLVFSLLVGGAVAFALSPRGRAESAPARGASADTALATRFGVAYDDRGVRFDLDVTNTGRKRVELTFPNAQAYDFVVVDSSGREVWRWAQGRLFTQTLQNRQLGTGDTMRIAEHWSPRGLHGRYTAIATLRATNFPLEQRLDFVIQ